jgi:hypothetical protein
VVTLPPKLVKALHWLDNWANLTVYEREWFEVRRLDFIIAAAFAFCIAWYGYWYGWQGAVAGGWMFIVTALAALLLRR